jgi:hypothetical protein
MQGILFKPWKHKAIRENPDRKWMTRRIMNPQPYEYGGYQDVWLWAFKKGWISTPNYWVDHSRYKVGEILYIEEALYKDESGIAIYKLGDTRVAPNGGVLKWRWKRDTLSAMFIPEEARRDFIQITAVRAERYYEKNLTPQDIEAEGGQQALDYLKQHEGKWLFVYSFKKVERP